jgi:diphosphomevalonate decarboxylase
MMRATSLAHPNIALAKYWGKRSWGENLPSVPSLSVTLHGMATRTEVTFDEALAADELILAGEALGGRPLARASDLLDRVARAAGRTRPRARVVSANDFPTASGLASSASAFAALAVAANGALDAGLSAAELSCIARRVSASAGRSLFGGFVVLPAGEEGQDRLPAEPLAPADHWAVAIVVAVTTEGKKDVGSTEGMLLTARTSPLYQAWVDGAPALFRRVKEAVLARDMEALGPAVEQSALTMHASALAADPGLVYWNGTTVEVMREVRAMRAGGAAAYFTIDAGPHVKVLTPAADAARVAERLAAVPGVKRTITALPGEGARLERA